MLNKKENRVIMVSAVGNHLGNKGYPIGINGRMPWTNSTDLKWFRQVTMGGTVIMGRRTYEAIGGVLDGRVNIIVSNTLNAVSGAEIASSFEDAMSIASNYNNDIFIIGGGSIYEKAIESDVADFALIDFIEIDCADADTFLKPFFENGWSETSRDRLGDGCTVVSYSRRRGSDNSADEQYIGCLRSIMDNGVSKSTRSGGVRSLFGMNMRFDLSEGLPVITTKRMYTRGCIGELLWFLSGSTNIKPLIENDIHIWDSDAYRFYREIVTKNNSLIVKEHTINYIHRKKYDIADMDTFLENVMKGVSIHVVSCEDFHVSGAIPNECEYDYTFGDLGCVYGKQWTDWSGTNQVMDAMNALRNDPDSRRIIISAWNSDEIHKMALPPCHYSYQFYTRMSTPEERKLYCLKRMPSAYSSEMDDGYMDSAGVPKRTLSLMWNQRSCDFALGIPFNILSYSVLAMMAAHCADMIPGEVIFNGGDCHIYDNQAEGVIEQIGRDPKRYGLPELVLNRQVSDIFAFCMDDIMVNGYESYGRIKFPLSTGL